MTLQKCLEERRQALKTRWLGKMLDGYPGGTAVFLKQRRNRFSNPVAHIFASRSEVIVDAVVCGTDLAGSREALEDLIKVRSVQDFSASQAVSPVYALKEVIRDVLAEELRDPRNLEEFFVIESRVDELCCLAFDMYMKCRERIFELRVNEIKRTGFRLLQQADVVSADKE
jgi:hypothetical protein